MAYLTKADKSVAGVVVVGQRFAALASSAGHRHHQGPHPSFLLTQQLPARSTTTLESMTARSLGRPGHATQHVTDQNSTCMHQPGFYRTCSSLAASMLIFPGSLTAQSVSHVRHVR